MQKLIESIFLRTGLRLHAVKSNLLMKKIKKKIKATLKIINLSEEYYQSALKGLAFLSLRNRFAILTALIIYRQIGQKIVEKKFSNLYKREIIGFFGKVLCLLRCFTLFIFIKKDS